MPDGRRGVCEERGERVCMAGRDVRGEEPGGDVVLRGEGEGVEGAASLEAGAEGSDGFLLGVCDLFAAEISSEYDENT